MERGAFIIEIKEEARQGRVGNPTIRAEGLFILQNDSLQGYLKNIFLKDLIDKSTFHKALPRGIRCVPVGRTQRKGRKEI